MKTNNTLKKKSSRKICIERQASTVQVDYLVVNYLRDTILLFFLSILSANSNSNLHHYMETGKIKW